MIGDKMRPMGEHSKNDPALAVGDLFARCKSLGPREAAELLARQETGTAVATLVELLPSQARLILRELGDDDRRRILGAAPRERVRHWEADTQYPENSIGRLMEPPVAVFGPARPLAKSSNSSGKS